MEKNCDGCVACCNGTLQGKIFDFHVYRGSPCKHVCFESKTCKIYEDRPDNPCKQFKCTWLLEKNMPEWMKPSLSGILITVDDSQKVMILHMVDGMEVNPSAIVQCLYYAQKNNFSIKFFVNGREKYTNRVNAFVKTVEGKMEITEMVDAYAEEKFIENKVLEE